MYIPGNLCYHRAHKVIVYVKIGSILKITNIFGSVIKYWMYSVIAKATISFNDGNNLFQCIDYIPKRPTCASYGIHLLKVHARHNRVKPWPRIFAASGIQATLTKKEKHIGKKRNHILCFGLLSKVVSRNICK